MSADHPTREMDNPNVPESLRHALRSAREAGPGAERLAQARESMVQRAAVEMAGGAAAIGASLIGSTGPSAAAGAAGSSAAAVGTGAMATSVGKVLLVGALLGLGGGGLWWLGQDHEGATASPETASVRPPPAPVESKPVPAVRAAEPAKAAEPAAPEIEVAPPADPEPVLEEAAPAPERRRARRVHRRTKPAPRPPARALSLADEIALLTEARASLQDRPAETLRLASEHAELFPLGRFVQEREVLAVHALLRRGKRDAALERGRRFLQTYPNSTHARRVDALLQEAER